MISRAGTRKRMINMADVAIKPASTTIESDGTLKLPEYSGRPGKLIPAYLVSLEGPKKGTEQYFIATKYDDAFVHCAKFVGFYHGGPMEDIVSRHSEIIEATPVTNFVEIMFPWNRVLSIRSLVYRHKVTGERK
jgi:hypothetical protein